MEEQTLEGGACYLRDEIPNYGPTIQTFPESKHLFHLPTSHSYPASAVQAMSINVPQFVPSLYDHSLGVHLTTACGSEMYAHPNASSAALSPVRGGLLTYGALAAGELQREPAPLRMETKASAVKPEHFVSPQTCSSSDLPASTASNHALVPKPIETGVGEDIDGKPYAQLIYQALMEAPTHKMVLQEIYDWFRSNTDKARTSGLSKGWQNSIRHNLSMNEVNDEFF